MKISYSEYIKTFISINPVKVVCILVMMITPITGSLYEKVSKTSKVLSNFEHGGKFHYVIEDDSKNLDPMEIKSFDKEIEIKENSITYEKDHPVTVFSIALFLIALIIVGISTMANDDQVGWQLSVINFQVHYNKLECEFENEWYYYTLGDYLLMRSEYQPSDYDIKHEVRLFIEDPKLYPKWKSKRQKRKETLNEILE